MANHSKIPHTLRLVIFLLRVTLGASFFYLGFATLFNSALEKELRAQSLTSLYSWLGNAASSGSLHLLFEWAFLVVGIFLVIGLFTSLASIIGFGLVLASYLPTVLSTLTVYQFISNELIVLLCLLILVFGKAGTYLGMDKFIRVSSKHPEA